MDGPGSILQPVIYTLEFKKRNAKFIGIAQNSYLIEPRWKSVNTCSFDLQTEVIKIYPYNTPLEIARQEIDYYANLLQVYKILDDVVDLRQIKKN